jgi:hypothetical protein
MDFQLTSIESCLNPFAIRKFVTDSRSPCNIICPALYVPPVPRFVFNSLAINFTSFLSSRPRTTVVGLLNFLISLEISMLVLSLSNSRTISSIDNEFVLSSGRKIIGFSYLKMYSNYSK